MARGGPGVAWRAREYVDRSARQSPARLALGVFGLVIAMVTLGLLRPVGDRQRTAGTVRRRAVHRRRRPARSPAWSSVPTGDVLVAVRAWS